MWLTEDQKQLAINVLKEALRFQNRKKGDKQKLNEKQISKRKSFIKK
jgi:hypothetical protein